MSDAVVITPMRPDHLSDVLRIEKASFSSPWSRESFLREMERAPLSVTIVAQEAETVIGYIVAWCIIEEAHIGNVAVDPDRRRQGVGRMMMDWFLQHATARGCAFATLEVRDSNHAARHLYASLGFAVAGRRRRYYLNPSEDAVVMVKSL